MNTALWVCQVLLVGFVFAAVMKLVTPIPALRAKRAFARHMPAALVRLIGAAELLGAAGATLPGVLHVATWLIPLAAAGLVLDMLGAVTAHLLLREPRELPAPLVLGLLALFVAVGRAVLAPL